MRNAVLPYRVTIDTALLTMKLQRSKTMNGEEIKRLMLFTSAKNSEQQINITYQKILSVAAVPELYWCIILYRSSRAVVRWHWIIWRASAGLAIVDIMPEMDGAEGSGRRVTADGSNKT